MIQANIMPPPSIEPSPNGKKQIHLIKSQVGNYIHFTTEAKLIRKQTLLFEF